MANKPTYTSLEREWLEEKFRKFQKALDNYDLDNLMDRYGPKELPNGKVVNAIIESRTDQLKAVMYILERLPKMLASLDELRAKDDKIAKARAGQEIPDRMKTTRNDEE